MKLHRISFQTPYSVSVGNFFEIRFQLIMMYVLVICWTNLSDGTLKFLSMVGNEKLNDDEGSSKRVSHAKLKGFRVLPPYCGIFCTLCVNNHEIMPTPRYIKSSYLKLKIQGTNKNLSDIFNNRTCALFIFLKIIPIR